MIEFGDTTTLHAEFLSRCRERPGSVAIADGEFEVTYEGLERSAARMADQLTAAGVRPGDCVGIFLPKSWRVISSMVAILSLGCTYVPLDPEYPPLRIAFMAADSGVRVVIAESWPEDFAPRMRTVLPDDEAPRPHARARREISREVPAYIIYTSGSSGEPKGVRVAESGVIDLFQSVQEHLDIGSDDVWSWTHSYSFDFSVWEIWGALLFGGRVVVVPKDAARRPSELLDVLAARGVTVFSQVPSSFKYVTKAYARRPADLALRYVIFGGEAMDPLSVREWLKRRAGRERLINMYGITETTVHTTCHEITPGDTAVHGDGTRIGVPLRHLVVALLDEEGRPVPAGDTGEIYVSGSSLALGYHQRPELTEQRFPSLAVHGTVRRWYRSGDLARQLPDGGLEYLGRADRQVNLHGFRIELGEVEAAVRGHVSVADAVAAVEPVGRDEHLLVAYVVPEAGVPGDDPDELTDRLRDSCGRVLPAHMVPHRFVLLPEIPLTASGKLDRGRLRGGGGRRS